MFAYGIEHEVAFLDQQDRFIDFSTTTYADLDQIIKPLPIYEQDYPQLYVGDAGIRVKRWYIDALERMDPTGKVIDGISKGIEIRTTIHTSIQGAIDELSESFERLRTVSLQEGLLPVLASFNPYRTSFDPNPPLTEYEKRFLQLSSEDQDYIYMLSYGPDLNISYSELSTEKLIDIGRKLTYYSPYIIPFSYSSPFYAGKLWDGLSVRTFKRTGIRPAAVVFLKDSADLVKTKPWSTKLARVPEEVGRIEFKSCDSSDDFSLYASLLALLKGLVLDDTLPGRASVPDAALHQHSARYGFSDTDILNGTRQILQAAERALEGDPDWPLLRRLYRMLHKQQTPAHDLIDMFRRTGSILEVLRSTYPQYAETQS